MDLGIEFEKLIFRTLEDAKSIRLLEKKVDELVQCDDINTLRSISNTTNQTVKLYLCKVLELRIKRKVENGKIASEEIILTTELMIHNYSYHVGNVYTLAGMFYWPKMFSDFFENLWCNGFDNKSYEILLLFLKKVNGSNEIDEKRRTELKTAVRTMSKDLLSFFNNNQAYYVIQIFTELLKMIPLDYDYSLVFEKAAEYPYEAIDFFVECGNKINSTRMIEVLEILPPSSSMVVLLCGSKLSNEFEIEKACSYVYRNLETNVESFPFIIDFFTRINWTNREVLLTAVLRRILEIYLSFDEIEREETCGSVNGLFSAMTRGCCTGCIDFLLRHEDGLPEKLASSFLQKVHRSDSLDLLKNIHFKSAYLNCFNTFFRNDSRSVELIDFLDLNNKEHSKLISKVICKFPISECILRRLLNTSQNGCVTALEIYVECSVRLSQPSKVFTNFNGSLAIEFYYFLKKNRENYLIYANNFFTFFIQSPFFDRCFAILKMLGNTVELQDNLASQHIIDCANDCFTQSNSQQANSQLKTRLNNGFRNVTIIPEEVLRNIYDKLGKCSFIEYTCFNNDLLCFLPLNVQKPFFYTEITRFIAEWNSIDDHRPYYHAIKSLLTVIAMYSYDTEVIDLVLELLVIDFSVIIAKIVTIIMTANCNFNTSKAVYYFFSCFISSSLYEVHPQIVNALTFCMAQKDGPYAFAYILKFDQHACEEIKARIDNSNRKTGQNIMRKFISGFRGKPFRNLYETSLKVTKQNFLPPKTSIDEVGLFNNDFI